jgi:hypothetical protein
LRDSLSMQVRAQLSAHQWKSRPCAPLCQPTSRSSLQVFDRLVPMLVIKLG